MQIQVSSIAKKSLIMHRLGAPLRILAPKNNKVFWIQQKNLTFMCSLIEIPLLHFLYRLVIENRNRNRQKKKNPRLVPKPLHLTQKPDKLNCNVHKAGCFRKSQYFS